MVTVLGVWTVVQQDCCSEETYLNTPEGARSEFKKKKKVYCYLLVGTGNSVSTTHYYCSTYC